ncbi:MAG: hypothetical protein QOF66_5317 [Mycobacterium sp.]|jgi:hypothetical protein|nr:hypothetical protein [Mycobacterium sp.]
MQYNMIANTATFSIDIECYRYQQCMSRRFTGEIPHGHAGYPATIKAIVDSDNAALLDVANPVV